MIERLTVPLLKAIQAACAQLHAGDPGEIEGCDTEDEQERLHADMRRACRWAQQEMTRRNRKRALR